ncbi:MAG: Ig-like domain-containing protein [Candidatus Berkiella sp.]
MAEQESILIDEEKLLRSLKEVSIPDEDSSFHFQSLFIPFQKALKEYVSLDEATLIQLLNKIPKKQEDKNDEFINLKFEELLSLPVDIGRKDVNQVSQQQSENRIEPLKRVLDSPFFYSNNFSQTLPKMQIFTISLNQPTPYPVPSILQPPVVHPQPGLPFTPSIVVDGLFTGGLNTEVLLNTQALVSLEGNVFHEGANGGILLNAYFAQPVRPGATENRSFSDKVVLTTPEGNTFTLYIASTAENWIGDFVYELGHALPHQLANPNLDVTIESGHKVFTEHFQYSLTNNVGANVGNIDIKIVDDVPVATDQNGDSTITEADINSIGTNQTNQALQLNGNLFSAPTLAVNRLGPDGGTVFDVYLPNNVGTVVATINTLTVTTPQGNELVINRLTGAYTYTLNAPFDNTNDPNTTNVQAQEIFTYEFLDSDGDSASATLTITILDDKPIANAKLNTADETALFVNLSEVKSGNLITDDDGFGESLLGADGASITKINGIADGADLDGLSNGIITVSTTYGSIDVYVSAQGGHQIGDYVYTLDSSKTVLANDALIQVQDVITYQLTDADTPSTSSSQLTITITLNQAPIAVDDTATIDEDTVLNVNAASGVLSNDTDPNAGDTKTVSAVNGVGNNVGNSFALPSGADLQLNADGSYSYDPRVAFNYLSVGESTTDLITYTMQDAEGLTSDATLTITITGVNDAPTANDDSNTTHGNTVIDVNSALDPNALLANDTDPDQSDTLVVSAVNGVGANVGNQFALPSGALLTVNADGTYQYDPNGQFAVSGNDSFTYTISDANGGTDTATVNISIIVPPIVLDLNDDGISFISLKNSTVAWQFPCGNYHTIGWVGPDDGILVYDANQDGNISLYEFSFSAHHPDAKTDLEGLRLAYDTNHDGIFDANDEHFSQFSVWQDKNSDGVADIGELTSLIDMGIVSISLQSNGEISLNEGNVIFGMTQFTTLDGKVHQAADVGLLVGETIQVEDVFVKNDELDFSNLAQLPTKTYQTNDMVSTQVEPLLVAQSMLVDEPVVLLI